MTAEEYRALLAVDFEDVESGGLTDISKLRIDKGLPLENAGSSISGRWETLILSG